MEKPLHPPLKTYDLRRLDIVAFAEEGATIRGVALLRELARLYRENPSADEQTPVQWQAQGRLHKVSGGAPEIWLELHINITLPLQCQRCLQPMQESVAVERSFRFVPDEATAAQLDDELEADVLVSSSQFDLLALVEDELIMTLPLAPRHVACQPAAVLPPAFENEEEQPHPFAALQQLKKTPPH